MLVILPRLNSTQVETRLRKRIFIHGSILMYKHFHHTLYNRGLQCFKLIGNQTENDRYLQKITFLLLEICLKMYGFLALEFKIC
jgi:hypothetical protein